MTDFTKLVVIKLVNKETRNKKGASHNKILLSAEQHEVVGN